MGEFSSTDFVQVKYHGEMRSGEPNVFWRNALYVGLNNELNHIVIYTDGTKQVLRKNEEIRTGNDIKGDV